MRAEKLKQINGADTRRHPFDHHHSDTAIASEQNHGRHSDPAFFLGIEQTPGLDHFLLRVTQNWKR